MSRKFRIENPALRATLGCEISGLWISALPQQGAATSNGYSSVKDLDRIVLNSKSRRGETAAGTLTPLHSRAPAPDIVSLVKMRTK
jgi:hypothetical protein